MPLTLSSSGFLGGILVAVFVAGFAYGTDTREPPGDLFPPNPSFSRVPADTGQLVVAAGKSPVSSTVGVYLFSRRAGKWSLSFPPLTGVAGRKGFADPGAKREGDGRTPSGVYPLQFVFGYAPRIRTKMPYRQATAKDVWVDDTESEDYNRWVERDRTRASSFEELRRKDHLYKYGLVVGYNMDPVIKGRGSAIFVHVWKGPAEPTSGCLALAEGDLMRIVQWLDPREKPLIVMGTGETVSAILE